ncbi:MAG: indolepyruvate ferredoxin oxidoreductase family protein, partial [Pseudomonadota bacterium]
FISAMVPILYPSNVQEVLDFGLFGWAMSRYSGCWVGFKCVAENMESSASVSVDPDRLDFRIPNSFDMPEGGLNLRWPDGILEQEDRLQRHKVYAAVSFARTNQIDRLVIDGKKPRLGIITAGKSYLDVRQALDDLGIDAALASEIGIRVYKVGMVWPLEKDGVREFARGLEEVVVVEEKRALIENQLKEQLYNWDEAVRPRVIGKFDEDGKWLLQASDELTPGMIARALAARILKFYDSDHIRDRLAFLDRKERSLGKITTSFDRQPYFCSGCPHNTSTRVPEGSRAMAGIGCHFMSLWMDRNTTTFTHMGGEGVPWIGQAPFSSAKHVFVNLGDGTYYHSGILAIRYSVAAGVNITYKILYNDAVAMTGGQPVEGQPTVADIARQVSAEGVAKVVIVSDEPDKYPTSWDFPGETTFRHRDDLDDVQKELREWQGTTVLIYDQTCAAEKRRRRKRGKMIDPPRRVFINEKVCEGCGDCSFQSNCMSVIPNDTEFGRKKAIDQSSCNKDYSCVKGFCPSFVSVYGAIPRKAKAGKTISADMPQIDLPDPVTPSLDDDTYGILVTGVGGTGVITIGALLGMAAHIEGRGVSVLDMTGLAQKGGAVTSHVQFGKTPDDLHAVRIAAGEANAVIGCDLVVAAGPDALAKMRIGVTRAVVNGHETMTAGFIRDRDLKFPSAALGDIVRETVGADAYDGLDATAIATALMGDSIATNMFMLGFAIQKGLVPISLDAIERAIELNGIAVASNKEALTWGRRAAVDLESVRKAAFPAAPVALADAKPRTFDEIVEIRTKELTAYQNAAYASRYETFVREIERLEEDRAPGEKTIAEAVARNLFKLMAYKDEYEVARLYSDGKFMSDLRRAFDGDYKMKIHLAPPLFAPRDPETGHLQKIT